MRTSEILSRCPMTVVSGHIWWRRSTYAVRVGLLRRVVICAAGKRRSRPVEDQEPQSKAVRFLLIGARPMG